MGGETIEVESGPLFGVEIDVEVLTLRLMAGGERESERELRARGEPLAVGHREVGSAQRTFPAPGDVTV